jgi:hypothetical protein
MRYLSFLLLIRDLIVSNDVLILFLFFLAFFFFLLFFLLFFFVLLFILVHLFCFLSHVISFVCLHESHLQEEPENPKTAPIIFFSSVTYTTKKDAHGNKLPGGFPHPNTNNNNNTANISNNLTQQQQQPQAQPQAPQSPQQPNKIQPDSHESTGTDFCLFASLDLEIPAVGTPERAHAGMCSLLLFVSSR